MPLYLLVRPSKKGNGKATKGLHDYMHKRARYGRAQSYPAPTAQNPLPCYVTEEPPVFDEEGKELDPNAEVWKTYVRETNLVDEELVDAWNKSMDVILIFVCQAALFSAISTAFVLESYKSLKQDPADASSQTLLTISQTLMFIANGSQPANTPLPSEAERPAFQASAKDICVNVLWFLSLSLSVAVSLISMLAKEWSLEFMSGRIGVPGAQARRRQQRWDGVKKWRMQEFLVVLPSLIHLSLLLFAIGLCVFLWDVHYGVAIPVMIVTTVAAVAYLACTVVPFLYDYCPYGTVLSRLVKQLTGIRAQINQTTIAQPEVTARALDWMITNCETPRVIDLVFRSLAAGDENMPPELFERSNTRAVLKWRMELAGSKGSEADTPSSVLPDRICKAYVVARKKTDGLNGSELNVDDTLAEPVYSIQLTINSLIREKLSQVDPNDHITIRILQRCMLIGLDYLRGRRDRFDIILGLSEAVDAAPPIDDLVERLEQYLSGSIGFDPDLYCLISICLAFTLCCNADKEHTYRNMVYILRLIRAYHLGPLRLPSDPVCQMVEDNLILGALWLLLSPSYQDLTALAPVSIPPEDKPKTFEALWAGCMNAVYLDRSVLKRFDSKYWTHGMLYLLTNPKHYNLSIHEIEAIGRVIDNTSEANDIPKQIQNNYYASYIRNISQNLSSRAQFARQLIMALRRLKEYAPWDDEYIFPTPDIHVFVVELILSGSRYYWQAPDLNNCFPIPKLSPRLAELLSSGNLISQLSILLEDNELASEERLFATAQLWLYLNMSLREPDRSRSDLSTLEQALLKYPRLAGDIQNQEEAAEELEDQLAILLDQVDDSDLKYWSGTTYMCRIFELMLQYRYAPLPEFASTILADVPTRLRGVASCVNLEDEWRVLYSDAGAIKRSVDSDAD